MLKGKGMKFLVKKKKKKNCQKKKKKKKILYHFYNIIKDKYLVQEKKADIFLLVTPPNQTIETLEALPIYCLKDLDDVHGVIMSE